MLNKVLYEIDINNDPFTLYGMYVWENGEKFIFNDGKFFDNFIDMKDIVIRYFCILSI